MIVLGCLGSRSGQTIALPSPPARMTARAKSDTAPERTILGVLNHQFLDADTCSVSESRSVARALRTVFKSLSPRRRDRQTNRREAETSRKRWWLEQNAVPAGQEVGMTNAHVAAIDTGAPALKATADLGDEHAGLRLQFSTLGSSQGRTKVLLWSAGLEGVHTIISIHPASRGCGIERSRPSLSVATTPTSRRSFSHAMRVRCATSEPRRLGT